MKTSGLGLSHEPHEQDTPLLPAGPSEECEQHKGRQQQSPTPNSLSASSPTNMQQALYSDLSCTSQSNGISKDGISGTSGNTYKITAGQPASSRHVFPLLRQKQGQKGLNHSNPGLCWHTCPAGQQCTCSKDPLLCYTNTWQPPSLLPRTSFR